MNTTPTPWIAGGSHIVVDPETSPCRCWPYVSPNGERSCPEAPHNDCSCVREYGGTLVAESMFPSDATRAALCVNALRGVPDSALTEGALDILVNAVLALLDAERVPRATPQLRALALAVPPFIVSGKGAS